MVLIIEIRQFLRRSELSEMKTTKNFRRLNDQKLNENQMNINRQLSLVPCDILRMLWNSFLELCLDTYVAVRSPDAIYCIIGFDL